MSRSAWKRPHLKPLGRHLRALREARMWSRDELGARLHSNGAMVRRLEEGLQSPRPAMLAKLALVLGVGVADLIPPSYGVEASAAQGPPAPAMPTTSAPYSTARPNLRRWP